MRIEPGLSGKARSESGSGNPSHNPERRSNTGRRRYDGPGTRRMIIAGMGTSRSLKAYQPAAPTKGPEDPAKDSQDPGTD